MADATVARHDRRIKHLMSKRPEYKAWQQIKVRCLNPKDRNFPNYGGRGITIAAEWISSFESFYEHVGARPSSSHSIDRIDNNGDYEPGNVRWATVVEQGRNRRTCRAITFQGRTQLFQEWADEMGLHKATLETRLDRFGWSLERALLTPPRPKAPPCR